LGVKCDAIGNSLAEETAVAHANQPAAGSDPKTASRFGRFYSDPYHNNPKFPQHYQGVVATVPFDTPPSSIDVDKKIKSEVIAASYAREKKQAAIPRAK
jgi:hypothetical protein